MQPVHVDIAYTLTLHRHRHFSVSRTALVISGRRREPKWFYWLNPEWRGAQPSTSSRIGQTNQPAEASCGASSCWTTNTEGTRKLADWLTEACRTGRLYHWRRESERGRARIKACDACSQRVSLNLSCETHRRVSRKIFAIYVYDSGVVFDARNNQLLHRSAGDVPRHQGRNTNTRRVVNAVEQMCTRRLKSGS